MKIDGKTMIVVAGGYTRPKTFLDTVEILDPTSGKGWILGPKLPYKSACTSMVTSPGGNGVILIGGLINYFSEKEDNFTMAISDQLWVLKAKAKKWVMLKQKLKNPRYWSVGIPLYDEWGQPIPGIDQRFICKDDLDECPPKKKAKN